MKKYLFAAAAVSALAMPAMADEVGVRAGPVGAGVTVGEGHRDYDRDRDRDRTTVIKEQEPRLSLTTTRPQGIRVLPALKRAGAFCVPACQQALRLGSSRIENGTLAA